MDTRQSMYLPPLPPPSPLPTCNQILQGLIDPRLRTFEFIGVQQWQALYQQISTLPDRHEAFFANDSTLPISADQCLDLSAVLVAAINLAANPIPDNLRTVYRLNGAWETALVIALSKKVLISLCEYTNNRPAMHYLGLNGGNTAVIMLQFSSRYDGIVQALCRWSSSNTHSLLPIELRALLERRLYIQASQVSMTVAPSVSTRTPAVQQGVPITTTVQQKIPTTRPLAGVPQQHAGPSTTNYGDVRNEQGKRPLGSSIVPGPVQKKVKVNAKERSASVPQGIQSVARLPTRYSVTGAVQTTDSIKVFLNGVDRLKGTSQEKSENEAATDDVVDEQESGDVTRDTNAAQASNGGEEGASNLATPTMLIHGAVNQDILNIEPPKTPTPASRKLLARSIRDKKGDASVVNKDDEMKD